MRFFISIFGGILIGVSLLLGYQRRNDFPQYIAFLSNRDGNSEVFLLNPETKTTKQLTFTAPPNNDYGHCWVAWQNFQIYIDYGRNYEPGDFDCYGGTGYILKIDLVGKKQKKNIDESYFGLSKLSHGDWSITIEYPPNSNNRKYAEIYRIHKGTGSKMLITTLQDGYDWPSQLQWTKNGKWIVYFDRLPDYGYTLYRIRPDGSGRQQLTNANHKSDFCRLFSISPNNEWVYFAQTDENNVACSIIYRVKLDEPNFGTTIEYVRFC